MEKKSLQKMQKTKNIDKFCKSSYSRCKTNERDICFNKINRSCIFLKYKLKIL